MSGADKLEMNMSKMDEGSVIMSEINAETTLDRIFKEVNLTVTEEEIQYYEEHMHPDPFQVTFVRDYFASCFGNLRDIYNISRHDYYKLAITLKKYLIMKDCYNPYEFHGNECPLAYILTGNMGGRLNNRIIRNTKFTTSLYEDETYQYLMSNKYSKLSEIRPDALNRLISSFVNTTFTYVAYENQEMLGKEIVYDDYEISKQLLDYIREF